MAASIDSLHESADLPDPDAETRTENKNATEQGLTEAPTNEETVCQSELTMSDGKKFTPSNVTSLNRVQVLIPKKSSEINQSGLSPYRPNNLTKETSDKKPHVFTSKMKTSLSPSSPRGQGSPY